MISFTSILRYPLPFLLTKFSFFSDNRNVRSHADGEHISGSRLVSYGVTFFMYIYLLLYQNALVNLFNKAMFLEVNTKKTSSVERACFCFSWSPKFCPPAWCFLLKPTTKCRTFGIGMNHAHRYLSWTVHICTCEDVRNEIYICCCCAFKYPYLKGM